MLFARAQLLTVNRDMANDLAQETWSRVLRARRSLEPDRNFAGYLITIATNIWRDLHRSARRAGPLSSQRLSSLDESVATGEDDVVLADAVPDLNALARDEQALLKLDVDRALELLTPLSRDVLTARYLDGLSAAEIGKRYGRSEQTITSWIRQAVQEVRRHLEEGPHSSTRGQDRP
jgi:RNA polymerase sigma factor (sigma-70 family)